MSAPEERGALTRQPSLYEYALRLHRAEPDGRLPRGGYPVPDPPQRCGSLGPAEAQAAVREVLAPC